MSSAANHLKVFLCGVIFTISSFLAYSQAPATSTTTQKDSTDSVIKNFYDAMLDFAALSYAGYAGEMDAEVGTVFSMALDKYKSNPEMAAMLNAIDDAVLYNALEEASKDFFRKTGVRIYFLGRIEGRLTQPYIEGINRLLEEKLWEKSEPFIAVQSVLHGNHSSGYSLSVQFRASPEINRNKYGLNSNPQNAFSKITGSLTSRRDVGRKIREELVSGTRLLTERFEENYLPNLMISFNGDYYKDREVIEIPAERSTWIDLTAINKEGNPRTEAIWTLTPTDSITAKAVIQGSSLRFPGWHAGNYTLALRAGSSRATITLKVTNFRQVLKQLLVEVLTSNKQQALDTLAVLRRDSANNAENLANYLATIERGNFPMEAGGTLTPMFSTPIVRSDSVEFLSNVDNKNSFNALKKKKKLRSAIRRKLNVVALADLLVDNPQRLNNLFDELLRNSGTVLAQLLLGNDNQGRASARNIIIEFLNNNLERIAGSVYAPSLSQEPPLVIPRPTGQQPQFDPKKFLYINPKANFVGKENLIARLNGHLDSLSSPLYVFINYSHDTDAETFLARTTGSRPAGLPEAARYKVFTVLNMPGSVKATVVSNAGLSSSITEAEGIEERVILDDEEGLLATSEGIVGYVVSDPVAYVRLIEPPNNVKEPKELLSQGKEVNLVNTTSSGTMALVKYLDSDNIYVTSTGNIKAIVKLATKAKFLVLNNSEAIKLPYSNVLTGHKPLKDSYVIADKNCGDFWQIKESTTTNEGWWVHKNDLKRVGDDVAPNFDWMADISCSSQSPVPAAQLAVVIQNRNGVNDRTDESIYGRNSLKAQKDGGFKYTNSRDCASPTFAGSTEFEKHVNEIIYSEIAKEGSIGSINTYDAEILTWGKGFAVTGRLMEVIEELLKDESYLQLFENVGIKVVSGNFWVLDAAGNWVKDNRKKKEYFASSHIANDEKLLSFFIELAEKSDYCQQIVDAQYKVFAEGAANFPNYILNQPKSHYSDHWSDTTVTVIAHLTHWCGYDWTVGDRFKDTKGKIDDVLYTYIINTIINFPSIQKQKLESSIYRWNNTYNILRSLEHFGRPRGAGLEGLKKYWSKNEVEISFKSDNGNILRAVVGIQKTKTQDGKAVSYIEEMYINNNNCILITNGQKTFTISKDHEAISYSKFTAKK